MLIEIKPNINYLAIYKKKRTVDTSFFNNFVQNALSALTRRENFRSTRAGIKKIIYLHNSNRLSIKQRLLKSRYEQCIPFEVKLDRVKVNG